MAFNPHFIEGLSETTALWSGFRQELCPFNPHFIEGLSETWVVSGVVVSVVRLSILILSRDSLKRLILLRLHCQDRSFNPHFIEGLSETPPEIAGINENSNLSILILSRDSLKRPTALATGAALSIFQSSFYRGTL